MISEENLYKGRKRHDTSTVSAFSWWKASLGTKQRRPTKKSDVKLWHQSIYPSVKSMLSEKILWNK